MRVLIVDDDPIALELLRDTLVDAGHEVSVAGDGQAALDLLHDQGPPQIIISDWEMPRLNGVDFCDQVRCRGYESYIYIILLTSHNTTAERIRGLRAGADDFITKPFEPAELLARMSAADRILSMETRDVAIFALAKLAESRDPETGAHLERVMNYSRVLAQQLPAIGHFTAEIDAEYIRLLYTTSPLHDIGKVGIPDVVLLNPGRLSPAEFQVMKTHTTIGTKTLDAALVRFPRAKFLRMARQIVATHHEKFDGSGYPAGLKGEEIPLCGRIVAVADVYDALTSKRVYKDAYTHDAAKAIILQGSGTHFDPRVIEAFLAAEQTFITIAAQFAEAGAPTQAPPLATAA